MPVDLATLGAFVLAATAIVVSPGPDTMLILRYALTGGRPVGFAAVAGVQLGMLVHTALAAAGVSAIIASSPLLAVSAAMLREASARRVTSRSASSSLIRSKRSGSLPERFATNTSSLESVSRT